MKYKVVISDNRYEDYSQEKEILEPLNVEIIYDSGDSETELAQKIVDADGLIVNLTPVGREAVEAMNKCKCVSRYGVGYDNVDYQLLKKKNIYLANVPDYCQHEVSDHALALLMACVRKITLKDKKVRQGQWNICNNKSTVRMAGKVFGFVGFGQIAKCLHKKLCGFDFVDFVVYDPFLTRDQAISSEVTLVSLEELCQKADFISIHAPLNQQTKDIISSREFALMKDTVILVNTSRGPLINQDALVKALRDNQIGFAGLDVYCSEPIEDDNPLKKFENVILTDHAGWYSVESVNELKRKAAKNIADVLSGKEPAYIVS